MTDGIDLSTCTLHGTLDPKTAQITAQLTGVEFATAKDYAVRPIHVPSPLPWPGQIPPGWQGPIQFTLWAFVNINGAWHGGAMQEFWQERLWCGANWLLPAPEGPNAGKNNWQANWAYDRARWGEMCDYVPHEGDEVGFMLFAGDSRPHIQMPTVPSRTNTIRVKLPLQGLALPLDSGPVQPPLEPPIDPPVTPGEGLAVVLLKLDAILAKLETLTDAQQATQNQVDILNEQFSRGFTGTTNGTIQLPPVFGGSRPFTVTQILGPVPE